MPQALTSKTVNSLPSKPLVEKLSDGSVRYTFKVGTETGSMTLFALFPGVSLGVNRIDIHKLSVIPSPNREGLIINCCSEGRCSVDLTDGKLVFVEKGNVSISTAHPNDLFQSSVGHYVGVEIFLDFDVLEKTMPTAFTEFGIDPFSLRASFCPQSQSYVGELPTEIAAQIDSLVANESATIYDYRLLTICCLRQIAGMPPQDNIAQKTWLTPTQAKIAQAVEAEMSGNLNSHITVASMAQKYEVSESSLRSYFHNMFGEPISSYIRHLRVDRAAALLENTEETIGDIALRVGYGNQSKFARAFKEARGLSPLEYRRNARLKALDAAEATPSLAKEKTE